MPRPTRGAARPGRGSKQNTHSIPSRIGTPRRAASEPHAPDIEVRYMPISELKPSPQNPRKITPEAFEGLKNSLKRFGIVQSIILNKRTGHVVGGHQRVAALKALGHEAAPVTIVDISETDEQLLNVSLNNPHIQGQFTDDLQAILDQLHSSLPDDVGPLNLNDLWNGSAFAQGKTDPDDVPEPPKKPISKLGDVWELGEHRVMCGDSLKIEEVKRLIDKNIVMELSPAYVDVIVKRWEDFTGQKAKRL